MPLASAFLLIRPAAFGYNPETAVNNFFQSPLTADAAVVQQKALEEFDALVNLLQEKELDVIVFDDTPQPAKPDAVFPNNWLGTLPNGTLAVFPMYAASRRCERRNDILQWLKENYEVKDVQDWSGFETEERYLEGTGSMVMDHDNRLIYAAISERTSLPVLEKFASFNNYQAIAFVAADRQGRPVYHTNVVMTLGDHFAILCEEAIEEEWELIAIRQLLESTGHVIIPITKDQMHAFAGNMLQVKNKRGQKYLLLSRTALNALQDEQKQMLSAFADLLPVSIPTIEQVEGGSVRCMIAEIFLQKK